MAKSLGPAYASSLFCTPQRRSLTNKSFILLKIKCSCQMKRRLSKEKEYYFPDRGNKYRYAIYHASQKEKCYPGFRELLVSYNVRIFFMALVEMYCLAIQYVTVVLAEALREKERLID